MIRVDQRQLILDSHLRHVVASRHRRKNTFLPFLGSKRKTERTDFFIYPGTTRRVVAQRPFYEGT